MPEHALISYGMKYGALVHVRDVERGSACGCTCPSCKSPLVAKKGERRIKHFAHYGASCIWYPQTIAHLLAKKVIEDEMKLFVPGFFAGKHGIDGKVYEISDVKTETKFGGVIPDLMVKIKDRWLIVEIFVTHAVSAEKLKRIEQLGVPCLEIPISHSIEYEQIKQILLNPHNGQWLFNKVAADARKLYDQELVNNYEQMRKHKEERLNRIQQKIMDLRVWNALLGLPSEAILRDLVERKTHYDSDLNISFVNFGVIIGLRKKRALHNCPVHVMASIGDCWKCPHYLGWGNLTQRSRFVLCQKAHDDNSASGIYGNYSDDDFNKKFEDAKRERYWG